VPDGLSLSGTFRKKLARFSDRYPEIGAQVANAILIGQIGKNHAFGGKEPVSGNRLLTLAFGKIAEVQRTIGGKLIYVECEDAEQLIGFYEKNGFMRLRDKKKEHSPGYFVQMIKYITM
jgi:hypothetical protein